MESFFFQKECGKKIIKNEVKRGKIYPTSIYHRVLVDEAYQ